MGKILKLEKDKSCIVRLDDGKKLSIYVVGGQVKVVELGFLDTENTTVIMKPSNFFDAIVAHLEKCKTLKEARRSVQVIRPGDKAVAEAVEEEEEEAEEDEDDDPPTVPVAGPIKRWMVFVTVSESLCMGVKDLEYEDIEAKQAILEAVSVYCDKRHPEQAKVQDFLDTLNTKGLIHEKSGFVILGNFYSGLSTIPDFELDAEKLRQEYVAHIQRMRRQLRSAFFKPPDIVLPSCFDDIEGAMELMEMAKDYAKNKNYQGAVDLMRKSVRRAPNHVEAYYLMSEYYLMEGDIEGAIGSVELLESIDEKDKVLSKLDYYVLIISLYKKIRTPEEMQPILSAIRHLALKYNLPAEEIEVVMQMGGWIAEPPPEAVDEKKKDTGNAAPPQDAGKT